MSEQLKIRVKKGQITLIKVRGFEISEEEEEFLKNEEIEIQLNQTYIKENKEVRVFFFFVDEKVNDVDTGNLFLILKEERANKNLTFILFGPNFSLPFKKKIDEMRRNSDLEIELWTFFEIFINPLNHYLSSPHKILNKEEIERELPLYKNKTFLSTLKGLQNDVIIRWLGGKVGDIVRIDYYSPFLEEILPDYRIVRKIII